MPSDVLHLLIVCTANQCRSAMGEVMARALFDERGIATEVVSAGTHAIDGVKATDGAEMTMRKRGLDLSNHRSQSVTAEVVATADLVLAMERQHVIDLVTTHGALLGRTYTLPEFAGLAHQSQRTHGETVDDWLRRLSLGRNAASGLSAPEIADPIGRTMRRYRQAAQHISDDIVQLIDAYAGFDALR